MLGEAIAIGRRFGNPDIEFEALSYLGGPYIMVDRVEEGLVFFDEALAAACAGELTDLSTVDSMFCGSYWACELVNDVPRADPVDARRRHHPPRGPACGRFETYVRPDRGFAAWPTNDDLTVLICGWPYAELEANRNDIEGNLKVLEQAPAFAERVRAARREASYTGTAVPNYFHKPYGPGWALVGDAGYNRDFITGQGIPDAFRDA
jgi:2-polyprenyl-6-methoxyphenol hydroxylase-like FAD-dependent oxidoreductase